MTKALFTIATDFSGLTKNHTINPDMKAMHADKTIKGTVCSTAIIMLIAFPPGGLLAARNATPGDSTMLM